MEQIADIIPFNLNGINRVVCDYTSKPPGTIEWEQPLASMTILYEPDQNRFRMPTEAGDAVVDFFWQGELMVLPHAEVPASLRGSGAGARLANGVFEEIETMGVKARPTCPFLVRVARSDPRWRKYFDL